MAKGKFSLAAFNKLRSKMSRVHHHTARLRAKAGETMETVVRTAEISGSAFTLGLVHSYFSDAQGKPATLIGVPVELWAGFGCHALALLGVGRGMESHLKAVGDGGIGLFFGLLGRGVGREMKQGGWQQVKATAYKDLIAGETIPANQLTAGVTPMAQRQAINELAAMSDY